MSNAVQDAVHELIEVASGRQAHLSPARADEMHEAITPGYNDKPLTEAEQAQLADLRERQAREGKAAKGKARAKDEDEDEDAG